MMVQGSCGAVKHLPLPPVCIPHRLLQHLLWPLGWLRWRSGPCLPAEGCLPETCVCRQTFVVRGGGLQHASTMQILHVSPHPTTVAVSTPASCALQ